MAERWASVDGTHGDKSSPVKGRIFIPSSLRPDAPDIVYLPGLFASAEDHATQLIAEAFARRSHGKTYAMSADLQRITPDSVQVEAQKIFDVFMNIRKSSRTKKQKPVIVVGHSHGGDVGISVTKRLEDNKIPVAGLVLLNTRGVSDEHSFGLATGITDEITNTVGIYLRPPRLLQADKNPSMRRNIRELASDLRNGVARDIFSRKIHRKVDACSYINPDADKIKTNIEMILGADDVLAHPTHIIPAENGKSYISNWQERGQYLQQTIFKRSRNISVHVAKHGGVHALPVLRPDTVANVAMISLQRMSASTQIFAQAA